MKRCWQIWKARHQCLLWCAACQCLSATHTIWIIFPLDIHDCAFLWCYCH